MAIAFLDLAASMPTKASLYSTMPCPPCAADRLGPPEQPSSRIVGRATSRAAGRTYGHTNRKRVQRLMRLMGIEALGPKPNTSMPAPGHTVYPYLLRGLTIERPNHV